MNLYMSILFVYLYIIIIVYNSICIECVVAIIFYVYILFLQNDGKEISWQHLMILYEQDHGRGSGLALVPKLKYEHVHLTSFSKMRVDLAAQVWNCVHDT